ncbi:MAG: type IV pilin N-terminal domain-containing protein [Deltaproteobacteria bacterium]|nr:type IV pilin N-terminal domain-containing protein [Deltaproteobacteria bacterium]
MKKIWKIRKDSEAVSPVIATILMVAITVVLAAVLYVMVMGFGGDGATAPTGSFTSVEKASSTTEKVRFGVITPDTKPTEIKIVIENTTSGSTETATYTFPVGDGSGALTQASGSIGGVAAGGIAYTDLAGNQKVSSGDYITITFAPAGSGAYSYKVSMIWIQNGAVIDDIPFSW